MKEALNRLMKTKGVVIKVLLNQGKLLGIIKTVQIEKGREHPLDLLRSERL